MLLCISGPFGTYYTTENGVEHLIFLILPLNSWDNRCLSTCLVYAALGIKLGLL